MGQKVHPIGMRVGIIRDWDAKWYAEKEYADYLHEDLAIRKFIQKELADASVSTIEIERAVNKVIVSLHTAKPGMVIGKGGSNVDALRAQLNKLTGKQVHINIVEIKKPDLDAHLVGETIAQKAKKAGVECVVFDRGGFLYHGRVAALAEAAREAGLMF